MVLHLLSMMRRRTWKRCLYKDQQEWNGADQQEVGSGQNQHDMAIGNGKDERQIFDRFWMMMRFHCLSVRSLSLYVPTPNEETTRGHLLGSNLPGLLINYPYN